MGSNNVIYPGCLYVLVFIIISVSVSSKLSTFQWQACSDSSCGVRSALLHHKGKLLMCSRTCISDKSCIGVSEDDLSVRGVKESRTCYIHRACSDVESCEKESSLSGFYAKKSNSPSTSSNDIEKCLNNGVWNAATNKCSCVDFRVGQQCERFAYSCEEIQESYSHLDKEWLFVDIQTNMSQDPIRVGCWFWYKNLKVNTKTLLFSNEGKFSFNKSWEDYKLGFQYDVANFWVGLENLHYLSNVASNKAFLIAEFTKGRTRAVEYLDFSVGDSSSNFTLKSTSKDKFHSSSGKIGDSNLNKASDPNLINCLPASVGKPFSTYDHESCNCWDDGCASVSGAGWWFSSCDDFCNPLSLAYEQFPHESRRDRWRFRDLNLNDSTYAEMFVRVYFYIMFSNGEAPSGK